MEIENISDYEIRQDIADTQAEIATMEREIAGLRMIGDRLSHYKADARVDGISKRREFIGKLNGILAERGNKLSVTPKEPAK